MAIGEWTTITAGPSTFCFACGDWLNRGDSVYETAHGSYCSEGCADDAEAHDDGMMARCVADGDYPD
jgi:hypothetical protein